jgi:hypothetical protein
LISFLKRFTIDTLLSVFAAAAATTSGLFVCECFNESLLRTSHHQTSRAYPSLANMKLTLTGKIFPILTQLFIMTPDKIATIVAALQNHVELQDLLIILYFGWTTVPLAHLIYEFVLKKDNSHNKSINEKTFEDTWMYCIATLFSQAMRVLLLVFLADCAAVVLTALGFEVAKHHDLGYITARLGYTIWIACKLANVKTQLLARNVMTGRAGNTIMTTTITTQSMGKAVIIDNLLNVVIAVITLLFLADLFQIDLGSGFASICALGGMQALVFSIASKDLVQQFRKCFVLFLQHFIILLSFICLLLAHFPRTYTLFYVHLLLHFTQFRAFSCKFPTSFMKET